MNKICIGLTFSLQTKVVMITTAIGAMELHKDDIAMPQRQPAKRNTQLKPRAKPDNRSIPRFFLIEGISIFSLRSESTKKMNKEPRTPLPSTTNSEEQDTKCKKKPMVPYRNKANRYRKVAEFFINRINYTTI